MAVVRHPEHVNARMQTLHVQQRWIELAPALAPVAISNAMSTMAAWCEGRLPGDAPSSLSFSAAGPMFKPAPLPALAAVPITTWRNFGGHLLAQAVNARAFSKRRGDAPAQHSLQLIGEGPVCQDLQYRRP